MLFINENYQNLCFQWKMSRDCYDGFTAIKSRSNREIYVKPTAEQRKNHTNMRRYHDFIENAQFENFYKPTINEFVGLMNSRPATMEFGQAEEILTDINYYGNANQDGLTGLKSRMNKEQCLKGRFGMLLEIVIVNEVPQFSITEYHAEKILDGNTFKETPDSEEEIEWALLDESGQFFNLYTKRWESETRYRLIALDADGRYYTAVLSEEDWEKFDIKFPSLSQISEKFRNTLVYPQYRGQFCGFVPFTVVNASKLGIKNYENVPFLDLAHSTIKFFYLDCLLTQGLRFSSNPTLLIFNGEKKDELPLGAGVALWLNSNNRSNASPTAQFLEVSGAGFSAIQQEKTAIKTYADSYSTRAILSDAGANASGIAIATRGESGSASISEIDRTGAKGIEEQLVFACRWAGIDEEIIKNEIKYEVDTKYISDQLSTSDIVVLLGAMEKGVLTEMEVRQFIMSKSPKNIEFLDNDEFEKLRQEAQLKQQ
jgi:hypothetical protein